MFKILQSFNGRSAIDPSFCASLKRRVDHASLKDLPMKDLGSYLHLAQTTVKTLQDLAIDPAIKASGDTYTTLTAAFVENEIKFEGDGLSQASQDKLTELLALNPGLVGLRKDTASSDGNLRTFPETIRTRFKERLAANFQRKSTLGMAYYAGSWLYTATSVNLLQRRTALKTFRRRLNSESNLDWQTFEKKLKEAFQYGHGYLFDSLHEMTDENLLELFNFIESFSFKTFNQDYISGHLRIKEVQQREWEEKIPPDMVYHLEENSLTHEGEEVKLSDQSLDGYRVAVTATAGGAARRFTESLLDVLFPSRGSSNHEAYTSQRPSLIRYIAQKSGKEAAKIESLIENDKQDELLKIIGEIGLSKTNFPFTDIGDVTVLDLIKAILSNIEAEGAQTSFSLTSSVQNDDALKREVASKKLTQKIEVVKQGDAPLFDEKAAPHSAKMVLDQETGLPRLNPNGPGGAVVDIHPDPKSTDVEMIMSADAPKSFYNLKKILQAVRYLMQEKGKKVVVFAFKNPDDSSFGHLKIYEEGENRYLTILEAGERSLEQQEAQGQYANSGVYALKADVKETISLNDLPVHLAGPKSGVCFNEKWYTDALEILVKKGIVSLEEIAVIVLDQSVVDPIKNTFQALDRREELTQMWQSLTS